MKESYVSDKRYSRFSELDELRVEYSTGRIGEEETGGIPIYVNLETNEMVCMDKDKHTLVVASSGNCKSLSVMMPMLIPLVAAGESYVVNDPKGEIFDKMSKYMEQNGYNVYVINLRSPGRSNSFNPFRTVTELYVSGQIGAAQRLMMQYAEILTSPVKSTKDAYWQTSASDYLCGLGLVLCKEAPDTLSLANIHKLHVDGEQKVGLERGMETYVNSIKEESPHIYKMLEGTVFAPSETRKSIISCFSGCMMKATFDEGVAEILSHNDFTVDDMVKKKSAVFIISPDESLVYQSVISIIVNSMYTRLTDLAYKSGGTLKRRFHFVLDEFGNMAAIPDCGAMLTAARSRNIRFTLAIQDYSQLKRIYSDESESIISNCDVLVYLHSPSYKLRKEISQQCGEVLLPYQNTTAPLLSPEHLAHLEKGEALLLIGKSYPYLSKLPLINEYEKAGYIELGAAKEKKKKARKEVPCFSLEKKLVELFEEKVKRALEANPSLRKELDNTENVESGATLTLADMDIYLYEEDECGVACEAELLFEAFNEAE